MRRYMKKCVGEREIALVESPDLSGDSGTRSSIQTTASDPKEEESSSATAGKRSREVEDVELSSLVELRSTRRRVANEAATESTLSPADGEVSGGPLTSVAETNCASLLPSCSSSNALVEIDEDRSTIADPTGQTESAQLETLTFSASRERISCSRLKPRSRRSTTTEPCAVEFGTLETTPSAEADSRHKQTTVAEMPSESEIEEFFTAAETDLQKCFSERYNFDVVNGVPLEGRYEWVPVKPAMR